MDFKTVPCDICKSTTHEKLFSKKEGDRTFTVVKCAGCGFQFMNPMITYSGLEKIYSREYYHNYNLHTLSREEAAMRDFANAATFRKIRRRIKTKPGRLLDVGCAMGFFLDSIRKTDPGWKISGCDISSSSVKFGKKKLGLDLRAGEVKKCRYGRNMFDIVTLRETIEHIREPTKTLAEINRITKGGGYLVIQTGNMDSLVSRISGGKHFYYNLAHVSYFSPKTIRRLLEKTGFTLIRMEGIHYPEEDMLKVRFRPGIFIKLLAIKVLNMARVGNFSVLGGMFVFAQKTGDAR